MYCMHTSTLRVQYLNIGNTCLGNLHIYYILYYNTTLAYCKVSGTCTHGIYVYIFLRIIILERAVYNISPDPSRWTTVRRSDLSPQLQLDAKSHLNLR